MLHTLHVAQYKYLYICCSLATAYIHINTSKANISSSSKTSIGTDAKNYWNMLWCSDRTQPTCRFLLDFDCCHLYFICSLNKNSPDFCLVTHIVTLRFQVFLGILKITILKLLLIDIWVVQYFSHLSAVFVCLQVSVFLILASSLVWMFKIQSDWSYFFFYTSSEKNGWYKCLCYSIGGSDIWHQCMLHIL